VTAATPPSRQDGEDLFEVDESLASDSTDTIDVRVGVAGGRDDLTALLRWLSDEDALRGRVAMVRPPDDGQHLGVLPGLLEIALGAGGAGSILASSLKTWLLTRRTSAKLTVTAGGRTVCLELETLDDALPLLERILKNGDAG
jgi:hypothetical protein